MNACYIERESTLTRILRETCGSEGDSEPKQKSRMFGDNRIVRGAAFSNMQCFWYDRFCVAMSCQVSKVSRVVVINVLCDVEEFFVRKELTVFLQIISTIL